MFELTIVLFPVDVGFDFLISSFIFFFSFQKRLLFPEQQMNINEAVALVFLETLNLGSCK